MSWIPRLPGDETGSAWIDSASSSPGWGDRVELFSYLAVSAPFVIKVLISSSWPYLAATWRGVLPYLSAQSISLPGKGKPNAGEWILNSSPRQRPGSKGGSSCGREGRTSSPAPMAVSHLRDMAGNLRPFCTVQNCKLLSVLGARVYPAGTGIRSLPVPKERMW